MNWSVGVSDIEIPLQMLSLTDKPRRDPAKLPETPAGPVRTSMAPIGDALVASPSVSFNSYLNATSVCFHLSENRFERMSQRVDFLNHLFAKVMIPKYPWGTRWMFDNPGVSFVRKQFPKESYEAPLSFVLSDSNKIDQEVLKIILQKFPKTQKLHCPTEDDEPLVDEILVPCINSCKKLMHLDMPWRIWGDVCSNIQWPQSLKVLNASQSLGDRVLNNMLASCQQLEELSLKSCWWSVGRTFFQRAQFPASLRVLNLDCTQVTDAALVKIAKTCSKLELLSLRECRNVTWEGIELAKFPPTTKIEFSRPSPRSPTLPCEREKLGLRLR